MSMGTAEHFCNADDQIDLVVYNHRISGKITDPHAGMRAAKGSQVAGDGSPRWLLLKEDETLVR